MGKSAVNNEQNGTGPVPYINYLVIFNIRYVLTLLNIMSAIYGDPTLGANLKFVILRLIFYEGSDDVGSRNFDPIEEGNSKQSLENVNQVGSSKRENQEAPNSEPCMTFNYLIRD